MKLFSKYVFLLLVFFCGCKVVFAKEISFGELETSFLKTNISGVTLEKKEKEIVVHYANSDLLTHIKDEDGMVLVKTDIGNASSYNIQTVTDYNKWLALEKSEEVIKELLRVVDSLKGSNYNSLLPGILNNSSDCDIQSKITANAFLIYYDGGSDAPYLAEDRIESLRFLLQDDFIKVRPSDDKKSLNVKVRLPYHNSCAFTDYFRRQIDYGSVEIIQTLETKISFDYEEKNFDSSKVYKYFVTGSQDNGSYFPSKTYKGINFKDVEDMIMKLQYDGVTFKKENNEILIKYEGFDDFVTHIKDEDGMIYIQGGADNRNIVFSSHQMDYFEISALKNEVQIIKDILEYVDSKRGTKYLAYYNSLLSNFNFDSNCFLEEHICGKASAYSFSNEPSDISDPSDSSIEEYDVSYILQLRFLLQSDVMVLEPDYTSNTIKVKVRLPYHGSYISKNEFFKDNQKISDVNDIVFDYEEKDVDFSKDYQYRLLAGNHEYDVSYKFVDAHSEYGRVLKDYLQSKNKNISAYYAEINPEVKKVVNDVTYYEATFYYSCSDSSKNCIQDNYMEAAKKSNISIDENHDTYQVVLYVSFLNTNDISKLSVKDVIVKDHVGKGEVENPSTGATIPFIFLFGGCLCAWVIYIYTKKKNVLNF